MMIKKSGLFIVCFLAIMSKSNAQNNWIQMKVDYNVSVKFPVTPQQTGNKYLYANRDSSIILALELHSMDDEDDSATPFDGILSKTKDYKPDEAKMAQSMTTWNGHTMMTSSIAMPRHHLYIQTLIFGGKAYMMGALTQAGADLKIKDSFFSSLKLSN